MDLSLAEELCKRFEGLHRVGPDGFVYPYICPAGVPTIGYGSTYYPDGRRVRMSDAPISQVEAQYMLMHELTKVCVPGVSRLCPGLIPLAILNNDWGTFCAIVDFTFNLGVGRLQTSTLRKRLNAGDWAGAKKELAKWVRGGGRVLPGLVARRKAEAALIPTEAPNGNTQN